LPICEAHQNKNGVLDILKVTYSPWESTAAAVAPAAAAKKTDDTKGQSEQEQQQKKDEEPVKLNKSIGDKTYRHMAVSVSAFNQAKTIDYQKAALHVLSNSDNGDFLPYGTNFMVCTNASLDPSPIAGEDFKEGWSDVTAISWPPSACASNGYGYPTPITCTTTFDAVHCVYYGNTQTPCCGADNVFVVPLCSAHKAATTNQMQVTDTNDYPMMTLGNFLRFRTGTSCAAGAPGGCTELKRGDGGSDKPPCNCGCSGEKEAAAAAGAAAAGSPPADPKEAKDPKDTH